ncbi:MAG: GNAT family N-acetyltransferase, partial [Patescibacteria group bacterium]|nr:GNAT family N-acetyltransferase [Patescibacteria group bacterium]
MEEKISYRKLKNTDVPEIFSLSSTVFAEDFPTYSSKTAQIYGKHIFSKKYYKDFLSKRKNLILGAWMGKELIGIICLKSEDGGVVFVDILFIKKNYRGKGIGSKFLTLAEKWALDHKNHYLWL